MFALTLTGSTAPPAAAQSAVKPGARDAGLESAASNGKRALGWLFLAGAVFHILFGVLLQDMPRASDSPHFSEDHYFLLLFLAPLAGFWLDKALSGKSGPREQHGLHARGFSLFVLTGLALPVALVPVLGLVTGHGLFSGLSVPLLGIRQMFLITVLVITARLAGCSPYFPLLGSCAWGLMLLHLVGFQLGGLLAARPVAQQLAAFGLAFGCVLCLWRFVRIAAGLAQLWETPVPWREGGTPPQDEAPAKLAAFAEAFALSGRETQCWREPLGIFRWRHSVKTWASVKVQSAFTRPACSKRRGSRTAAVLCYSSGLGNLNNICPPSAPASHFFSRKTA